MADETGSASTASTTAKPKIKDVVDENPAVGDTPAGVLSNPNLVGQHGAYDVVHASREEMDRINREELEREAARTDSGA